MNGLDFGKATQEKQQPFAHIPGRCEAGGSIDRPLAADYNEIIRNQKKSECFLSMDDVGGPYAQYSGLRSLAR